MSLVTYLLFCAGRRGSEVWLFSSFYGRWPGGCTVRWAGCLALWRVNVLFMNMRDICVSPTLGATVVRQTVVCCKGSCSRSESWKQ